LIIIEAENVHFFKCTRCGFVYQELRDFVKMTLTRVIDCDSSRVESLCEKCDSCWVVSPFFSTWLESSPSYQKSWLESSHWLESRFHC